MNELEMFLTWWDREAASTVTLLKALPPTQYDFRPDPAGRSLGELAWHLAEGDAYMSYGIERGDFTIRREAAEHRAPPRHRGPGARIRACPSRRRRTGSKAHT